MPKGLSPTLRKALSTAAGVGGDFIPQPLATEFIKFVRDLNWCRQLFRTMPMRAKTLDVPKVLGNTKVYHQPTEGGTAVETTMNTGIVQLTAKKLMAFLTVTQEVMEDAQGNFEQIVKSHFAEQLAAAEEEAMLVGDTAHTPLTATESLADGIVTWFNKDHRLVFDGLLTLSGDIAGSLSAGTRAANRVNGGGNGMSTTLARQAMHNMGKYGRTMSDLVLIVNPWAANQLLDDEKLVTLEKYGPQATVITGEFGRLYGKIRVINSAYMTDTYAVMTNNANPIIGDRRAITLKSDEQVKEDVMIHVITERIDFTVAYKDALCQIHNLEAASTES